MGTLAVAGQKITAAFLNQFYGFADTTDTTVLAIAQTTLTTPYTVPANEPVAGSAYELGFGGIGQQATGSNVGLSFTVVLQGTVITSAVTIAATAFGTNQVFRYEGMARFVCVSTGVSGAFRAGIWLNISQTANAVGLFTAATQSLAVADGNTGASTVDTTSSMTAVVKMAWTSATGAPTITNKRTIFRKVA